ncbi:tetratricopeptide repeat protein [Actinosynnema sp. NPDC050436]|uniref:tetratricopeptide repeat protein n=1 Tax=Actinosynnema sp. NPDC050436 TaxID=3155659 RepID=UPI0033F8937D
MAYLDLSRWGVRVLKQGRVCGAGVFIKGGRVLTCAHVVNRVLGRPDGSTSLPTDEIEVDFPFAAGFRTTALILAAHWYPVDEHGGGDVAVLLLNEPPPPIVEPAPLAGHGSRGTAVHVYGYPHGYDDGVEAEAVVSGAGGPGGEWVQLDAVRSTGFRVRGGFSGAGVVDTASGHVVGLLVAEARDVSAQISWMLPIVGVAQKWPRLMLDVRLPGPRAGVDAVNTLLPAVKDFTDRVHERTRLQAGAGRSVRGAAVFSVWGMPGVGKTALALHIAHELATHYPSAQLYIDLQAHSDDQPVQPSTALTRLLRLLGVVLTPPIVDVAELAELWRAELARREVVVVLDNAGSVEQIRPLLPGSSRSYFLITSRNRLIGLEDVEEVPLRELPHQDAFVLFARIVGEERVRDEAGSIDRLVRVCERLPLAVRVLASHLKTHASWSAGEFVDDAIDEQNRLGSIDRSRPVSVRAAFELSYRKLGTNERDGFRWLGLLSSAEFGPHVLSAVSGLDLHSARVLLEKLVNASLVQEVRWDRFRIHDLMREYARDRVVEEVSEAERRNAATRALDYYLHCALVAHAVLVPFRVVVDAVEFEPAHPPPLATAEAARSWFELEQVNLANCLGVAKEYGLDTYLWRIPRAIRYAVDLLGGGGDLIALFGHGLAAAEAVQDTKGIADMCATRGDLHHGRSRIVEAREAYERARGNYESLGDSIAAADMSNRIGRSFRLAGEPGRARAAHQEALAAFTAAGDLYGQAESHHYLGILDRNAGSYEEAVARQEQAGDLYRRTPYDLGVARAAEAIGIVHRLRGDFRAAIECFGSALRIYETSGDLRGLAHTLNNTASSSLLLGEPGTALEYVDRALQLFRKTGNRAGEADALVVRGRVQRSFERFAESRGDFLDSLRIAEEIGMRGGQANSRLELSKTLRLERSFEAALDHVETSLALYREMGSGRGVAIALLEAARCLAESGDPAALPRCEEAIAACERHNLPELAEARALLERIHGA